MKSSWPASLVQIGKYVPILIICTVGALLCNEGYAQARSHTGLVHAERAQALMQKQQNSQAIGEWETALKVEPKNPIYRNLYGLALQSVGRQTEARKQFQRAIQLKPEFADAHANLAYSSWTDGEEDAAILEFDRALNLQPSDPILQLARGLLAASVGRPDEACVHLDHARPWPNDSETLWRIFSAYLGCNRPTEALEAAKFLPADPETQLTIGKALLAFRQPESAVFFLERLRDAGLKVPDPILMLAEAHLRSGHPEKALQELANLAESQRVTFAALELRASCLLKMSRRSEAQAQFVELVDRFPDDPEVYIDATQIPLEDQNWDQSLEILNRGLRRIPGNWLLLFRRAMTFKLSARLNQARTDLLEAIHHRGDIPLLSAALGEVYASQDDLTGAGQIFRKTFDETGAPEFQFAYALTVEKQGNYAEALKEMQKAVSLLPNDARAHFEYGKLLQKNGQTKEARQELERAKEVDPNLSGNLYVLSRLYQSLGETNLATKTLKEYFASAQKSGASQR